MPDGEGWMHDCEAVDREVWVPNIEARCPFCRKTLDHGTEE